MEISLQKEDVDKVQIEKILKLQRANKHAMQALSSSERIERIKRVRKAMFDYREDIQKAIYKDFKKPAVEVDMTEIFVVVNEANHTIKHLKKWMQPQRVPTPLNMIGTSGKIIYEAKGNTLIIAPWNFPVNLIFGPLISALAAGNTVILKPSEFTPHTSELLKKIVEEIFDEKEVALLNGGVELSRSLLSERFDHIFFTGSPKVGKIVMKAAAEYLTSVTLELGGKSPTIIDKSANIKNAVKRILAGKFTNASQTCIAHDYIFIHRSKSAEFIEKFKEKIKSTYGEDASRSESYARIVNKANAIRLADIIEEVKLRHPEKIIFGGNSNIDDCYISPTLILNPDKDLRVMEEEIFGPIIPIFEYDDLDEVIDFINAGEKPLALYVFSRSSSAIKKVRDNTSSGSLNINETAIHYYHSELPFGGSNNSGIGKAHGYHGFKSFSHEKGILRQHLSFSPIELIFPPYTKMSKFWADIFLKYF